MRYNYDYLYYVSLYIKESTFYHVGILMALSLLHGGSNFSFFFGNSTYAYLSGIPLPSITVNSDEVPDYEVQVLIDKVCN